MGNSETNIHGGWNIYYGMTECKLLAEVDIAFKEALDGLVGASYVPVLYVGSQLVSGMNNKIVCKITLVILGQDKDVVEVTIYKPLNGHAMITEVKSIFK